MKITAIMGSPRKNGVTSRIAKGFLEQAEAKGAQTTSFFLNQMDFKGCQGCHLCKSKSDFCVLKDDLTPVLEGIVTSDILVFATPIYFRDVTGQFKCFFDRTWSLFKPDFMTNPRPVRMDPGKKALWVSSQWEVEEKYKEVVEKYTEILTKFGCETHVIGAFGMEDGPDQEIGNFLDQARDMADQLVG